MPENNYTRRTVTDLTAAYRDALQNGERERAESIGFLMASRLERVDKGLAELRTLATACRSAADGDSNDDEIDAAIELVDAVEKLEA
jgi:hypothetical protein